MNHVVVMKVIDGFEDLLDCLGSVFLCKLAVFTDPVKKLSSSRQLCDYIIFVLYSIRRQYVYFSEIESNFQYLRLEPIVESNDVWMFHSL